MSTLSPRPPCPNDRRDFEIAIICALPLEADAVEALFDHHWDDEDTPLDKEPGDPNAYSTGVIGRHNVVLSYMPGMGIANAAAVASNCRKSFPGIKLALVVGICGVVPFKLNKDEIVLGDVIVSDGIVQYDFGRQLPDHFARKDTLLDSLGRPNQEIRGVLAKHRRQLSTKIVEYLDVLRQEPELRAEYPGITQDRLFEASYRHAEDQKSCEQLGCNGELVLRRRLETAGVRPTPAVHFGLMASGNSVTKSGKDRDRIAAQEGVIAFEIEGADVWDSFPCIIIKGACDYADSHKSKVWQRYAAATAAACAKAFLSFWVPSNLSEHVSFTHLSQDQAMFLVPFARNDLFVGRNDILERLRSLLFEKNNRKVALFGLGGTGKTQIALELAYWVKETKPDYSVFWMPVLSMADFEGKCKMLVKAFGIQCSEGDDAKEAMRQHFSSKNAGKWFLIVDNADDMEILYKATHAGGGILDFLPFSDDGRILFTTRSKQVAVVAARNDVVKLSHMRRGEASDLLKKFLIDQDELHDNENVAQLLDILTYLPLAIAQAAAYMNIYEVSIKEYIQLLQHEDGEYVIELLEEGHYDGSYYDSSQAAVATTWIVSFEQIRRSAPLAADLLSFMAFIEPKAIPRSILPGLKTEQQMTQAIGTLLGHGFLSQRGREPMFDMHSLVHLVTRRWTENQGLGIEMQKLTLARVADVFPTAEWEHRDLWRQYLPHAIRLLRTTAGVKNEAFCNLGYQVGRCLLVDGRIEEAVAILENVIAIGEMTLEEDHLSQLASQHALAEAYQANGQIKEAVKLLEHMTAIWRKTLAGDHPSRLASQHELARAYLADSQIGKAVDMLEHIVAIKEKIQAEDHPSRLASQHALAGAYQADGQIKKAVELLEHVVAIREKALEEDHPDRLMSERELAMAYETNGWTGNDSYNSASETSSLSWSNNKGSTHLSSLSYGSFATQHQTAESRPTMTFFRYKKPEAEHETGTRDDDIQSIASISDDINSLAEAKYDKMANIRHAAMTYFVSTLAGIPGLLSLYEKAVKVMDEAKFVRNHRRMLKTYYLGLRAEGRTPSELLAIQFLRPRSNRTQISIQICHLVTSTESTVREQVTALLEQEKDNLLMIDRFLSERSYTGRQALPNHIHYTSHADSTRKHGENSDFDSDTDSDLDGNLDEKHETQFEENDVLSALEATKEFFVNGRPFRAYQDRMHEFLNLARVTTEQQGSFRPSAFGRGLESLKVAPRERGAMDRKTAMKMTVSSWWLWLMTKCCPPPAGYHRIPYICGCGELSHLDVKELSPGGIERFRQRIVRSTSVVKKQALDSETSPGSPNPPNLPSFPAPARMRSMFSQTFETSHHRGSATSSLPSSQAASITSLDLSPSSPEKPQFLLVCINTKHTTILEHLDVSSYGNDQHMFKQIRDIYRTVRLENEWRLLLLVPAWLRNLTRSISAKLPSLPSPLNRLDFLPMIWLALSQMNFHTIASADFVRFQMIPIGRESFPGWFQKRQFPPQDQVLAGKYLYEPVPMEDVDFLEIPLSHLLKPGDHLDKFWITTFPKKISEPLVRRCGVDGQRVIGWGIRINEELNWRYVLLLTFGILVVTGISVVSYAVITSDKSSAFGMGTYLVAVFTTYITYQYFAWKDEF